MPPLPLLPADVVFAVFEEGTGEALRNWLKSGQLELDAKYGGGWTRFSFKDVVRLSLIRRLVGVGITIREANELLRIWTRFISYPFDTAPEGAGQAFDGVKMIVWRNEKGDWTIATGEDDYVKEKMRADVLIVLDLGTIIGTAIARARGSIELRAQEKEQLRKERERFRKKRAAIRKPKPARKASVQEPARG